MLEKKDEVIIGSSGAYRHRISARTLWSVGRHISHGQLLNRLFLPPAGGIFFKEYFV
jgi:hypothetical protein